MVRSAGLGESPCLVAEEGAFDESADAVAFVGVELVERGEVEPQGFVLGSAFVGGDVRSSTGALSSGSSTWREGSSIRRRAGNSSMRVEARPAGRQTPPPREGRAS